MSTVRDNDAIIGTWLEEGPQSLPGETRWAITAGVRAVTQRRIGSGRPSLPTLGLPRLSLALGAVAVLLVVGAVALNFYTNRQGIGVPPSPSPSPTATSLSSLSPATPLGIFADLDGWIAYGSGTGIWAIDPAQPGNLDNRVRLSSTLGTPIAWSPDGSKLLVLRDLGDPAHPDGLFVLNADGTETRLGNLESRGSADFTPDGSQVIYGDGDGMYVVDVEGGTPELLSTDGPRWWALSPDGTQIAWLDWGRGDSEHPPLVRNIDGTGERVVTEDPRIMGPGHIRGPGVDWSPDGQRLVFAFSGSGVWVVGLDGSGLINVSSGPFDGSEGGWGSDPHWSPDGSLISYTIGQTLVIVRPDGAQVSTFPNAVSGPWSPR